MLIMFIKHIVHWRRNSSLNYYYYLVNQRSRVVGGVTIGMVWSKNPKGWSYPFASTARMAPTKTVPIICKKSTLVYWIDCWCIQRCTICSNRVFAMDGIWLLPQALLNLQVIPLITNLKEIVLSVCKIFVLKNHLIPSSSWYLLIIHNSYSAEKLSICSYVFTLCCRYLGHLCINQNWICSKWWLCHLVTTKFILISFHELFFPTVVQERHSCKQVLGMLQIADQVPHITSIVQGVINKQRLLCWRI